MVQKSNESLKILKNFKKSLKLPNSKFILFGSRAKGNFNKQSDFDVLIISDTFKNIPWHKRAINFQLNWTEEISLEVLCFTPDEIKILIKNNWGIVREAINTGIEF